MLTFTNKKRSKKIPKNGPFVKKGFLYSLFGGKVVNHESVREALDSAARCGCGTDCCNNVVYRTDRITGEVYVESIENGSVVLRTKAAFDAL